MVNSIRRAAFQTFSNVALESGPQVEAVDSDANGNSWI